MANVVWSCGLPWKQICNVCQKYHPARLNTNLQIVRRISQKPKSARKTEWKSVVGLEIHAQINTTSKLFSGAATKFGSPINSQVSHFDAALPGTLPVLNKSCVEAGVLTALALGCDINSVSKFDRKHYFYADLPAGYQITQQRQPLAKGGQVNYIHVKTRVGEAATAENRTCRLIQLQLEQDSGKSLHDYKDQQSLIDLNRAGVGLMELVTQPDLKDGEDAASFVREMQLLLKTIGTCAGKMQEGSLRVDANISVHREGEPLGVRTEVKNINSIRNVCKAIDFEIQRQIAILEEGGKIENETRSFDAESGETVQMRDKEKLLDYRFMPEPNLPPLHVYNKSNAPVNQHGSVVILDEIWERLPTLPGEMRLQLQEKYNIPLESASLLLREEGLLDMFKSIVTDDSRNVISVVNILLNVFVGVLREHELTAAESPISSERVGEVCDLVASRDIARNMSFKLLSELFKTPELTAREIVDRENWWQIRDRRLIEKAVKEAFEENPKALKKLLKGSRQSLSPIMGPVQKKLDRRGDLELITEIVTETLKKIQS